MKYFNKDESEPFKILKKIADSLAENYDLIAKFALKTEINNGGNSYKRKNN